MAELSRLVAAELLMEVLEASRTLDDALVSNERYPSLKPVDRAFTRAMVSAALRQLGRIDAGLSPFLNRPIETAAPPARALLRIGAAQLWCLGTPAHAGVGETVAAAKSWPRGRRAAGFLNAVLRKAAADRATFDAVPPQQTWPDWLWRTMVDSLGEAGASALALAQTEPPDLHLTLREGSADELAAELSAQALPSGSVAKAMSSVEALPGYSEGRWWVQDAAAAVPAKLLGIGKDTPVLDLCAAPGGKTMQLAAAGGIVTAIDRSSKRLQRVRENLARTGLSDRVDIIAAPAETWSPPRPARHILLDAPCSAMGTLRRHPEGAWIKHPNDISRYPEVQSRLLEAAIHKAASGAVLVYCVCSPLRAEGVDVVERALKTARVKRQPIAAGEVPGFSECVTKAGDLLTLPQPDRLHDAFYIARLRVV